MKITTYIDEQLLLQAMKETRASSQREVLEAGLRAILADVRRRAFIREFDSFRLRWSSDTLKKSRR